MDNNIRSLICSVLSKIVNTPKSTTMHFEVLMLYYTYDFMKLALILLVGWAGARLIRTVARGKPDLGRSILIWALFLFLLFLLNKTFSPFTFIPKWDGFNANLVPIRGILSMIENASKFDDEVTQRIVFINIVGNILIFSPFGLLFPVLEKRLRKWWLVVLLGLGMSLTIEFTQTLLAARVFDVDDLLLNSFGVWLGYALFWISYQNRLMQVMYNRIADAARPKPLFFCLGYILFASLAAFAVFYFGFSAYKLIPR